MNEIEKAIHRFKLLKLLEENGTIDSEMPESIKLAIQALQEKQERDKECEWCNKGLRFECCLIDDSGNTASIENNMVQTCIAKICPNCGRKIGESDES